MDLRRRVSGLMLWIGCALVLAPSTRIEAQQGPPSQPAPQNPPRFDVAAIHLHEPLPHDHVSISSSPQNGELRAHNVSLFTLMWWSFEMPEARILGAPSWAGTKRFDIEATADPTVDAQLKALASDAGRQQKEKMVQALLADRFRLVTHTETRELPIYNLVIAKGGQKLGAIQEAGTAITLTRDHLEVKGTNSVSLLAEQLSKVVGRDVVDKTGITGRYDLKLQWTPDDIAASAADPSGPSIFAALEEQLGLKLQPAKGPVTVLVIDHVEMPSPN